MSKARVVLVAVIAAAVVLTLVGLGTAASSRTDKYKASLNIGQEVPKPTGVPAGASGKFTATETDTNGGNEKLKWKLTFRGLSGKATQAHIHLGKRGKSGPVKVTLCSPCTSGAHGTKTISETLDRQIEAGKTYVNIHTVKNPGGEIRGQIKEID